MQHRLYLTLLLCIFTQSLSAASIEPPRLPDKAEHVLAGPVRRPVAAYFPMFFAIMNTSSVPATFSCQCGAWNIKLAPQESKTEHWMLPSLISTLAENSIINIHTPELQVAIPNACTMRVITDHDGVKGLVSNNCPFKVIWHYPEHTTELSCDDWFLHKTLSTPLLTSDRNISYYKLTNLLTVSCLLASNKDGLHQLTTSLKTKTFYGPVYIAGRATSLETLMGNLKKFIINRMLIADL